MGKRRGILSFLKNNKRVKEEEVSLSFIENGSMLLEELISSCDGRYSIPIRNFSVKDLLRATNNFDEHHFVIKDGFYRLYKGSLEERLICVKRFGKVDTKRAIRDIAITAQMSVHKNVLKLLGCCLEDEALALVYEYAGETFLSNNLNEGRDGHYMKSFPWKSRLRTANEIANVIAYLHTALQRPVVHRDIKPKSFIIDQHGVVKLLDFSLSISIPLGETRVKDVVAGTMGFLDPEYMRSSFVTEKCDVYSFGVLLLSLLSGRGPEDHGDQGVVVKVKSCVENDRLNEIVDPKIVGDGGGTDEQELQFHAFAALALRCTRECGDDRPYMIEVAKELRRIQRSIHLQAIDYMTELGSTSPLHTQGSTPALIPPPTLPPTTRDSRARQYIFFFILGCLFTKVLNYL